MNDVDINVAAVRKTGDDHFPELAASYLIAGGFNLDARQDHGSGFDGCGFATAWYAWSSMIVEVLETSAQHLLACGDTLVQVADDHQFTDEDNAYGIHSEWERSYGEAREDIDLLGRE